MCYFYNVETVWASQMAPVVKNSSANAGVIRGSGLIPGSGRSPGRGHGNPLQYSCLENPMDRGAWQATVLRVSKSRARLKWLSTQSMVTWSSTQVPRWGNGEGQSFQLTILGNVDIHRQKDEAGYIQWSWIPYLTSYTKRNSKWITDLKIRPEL